MASDTLDLGTPFLRFEREGHLAWCTIDRPDSRNALTSGMYYGLKKAVEIVNGFPEQTALIITGTGDVFAPGGEMRGKMPDTNPVVAQLGWMDIIPFEAVRNSTAPIVAAVNGICQGGGLLLSVLADVTIASERATFRSPELLRGVADSACAAYIAPHVGLANARDLLFTGRTLDAREAQAMGLIARVVPHDELLPFTRELALAAVHNDTAGVRRMLTTYNQIAASIYDPGWAIEDQVNREWWNETFDPSELARRREGVIDRGRRQVEHPAEP